MLRSISKAEWVNLIWLHPWFIMPGVLSHIHLGGIDLRRYILFVFSSACWALVAALKGQPDLFINGFALSLSFIIRDSAVAYRPSMIPGLLYLIAGTAYMVVQFFQGSGRIGLFGGEANFSGFVAVMFLCIAISRRKHVVLSIILVVVIGAVSASRALVAISLLVAIFYVLRHRKAVLLLLGSALISITFFGPVLLDSLIASGVIEASGYIENYQRLLVLADSSTFERLQLNEKWTSRWFSDPLSFLFGLSTYEYEHAMHIYGKVPHNSFIQRGAEFGVLFLLTFILAMVYLLPWWICLTLICYSLFLHNLLSVPWLFGILLFLGSGPENRFAKIWKVKNIRSRGGVGSTF